MLKKCFVSKKNYKLKKKNNKHSNFTLKKHYKWSMPRLT